jgi:hypothetical protein
LIVALAGIAKPKFVALRYLVSPPPLIVADCEFTPSIAVTLAVLFQVLPVLLVPAVLGRFGPLVPETGDAHAAADVSDPEPPWQIVTPVAAGGVLIAIEPVAVIVAQPPVNVTV